jgi:NhaP-type Na+/H+ or K+/H+ antiporter
MPNEPDWQPLNLTSETEPDDRPSTWDDWINRWIDRSPNAATIRGWCAFLTVFAFTVGAVFAVSLFLEHPERSPGADRPTWDQFLTPERLVLAVVIGMILTPAVMWVLDRGDLISERGRAFEAALSRPRLERLVNVAMGYMGSVTVMTILWALSEPPESTMPSADELWFIGLSSIVVTPVVLWAAFRKKR